MAPKKPTSAYAGLKSENAKLKAVIECKTSELKQTNVDLKTALGDVVEKLNIILEENLKLRNINDNLEKRVVSLENLLDKKPTQTENEKTINTDPPRVTVSAKKQPYRVLILSDSIFRHVAGDCPKIKGDTRIIEQDINIPLPINHPPITAKKIVIPGARCDRLWSEAVHLSKIQNL